MANLIENNPNQFTNSLLNRPTSNGLQAQNQDRIDQKNQSLQADASNPDKFSPSARGIQAAAQVQSSQSSYSISQSLSFSLTTQEGDTVQVDFKQLYEQYQSQTRQRAIEQGPEGVRQFESLESLESESFEQAIGFSVNGDLNEEELEAIYKVFDQVDKLANNFFDGNIEEAFQQAKDLDIDFGQIKNLSLEVTQTETRVSSSQQASAYQNVQDASNEEQLEEDDSQNGNVANLSGYIQDWQDIINTLDEQFANARSTFDEIFAGILGPRVGDETKSAEENRNSFFDSFKEFHDDLAAAVELDPQTLQPVNTVNSEEV
jgi:hypothetical protein